MSSLITSSKDPTSHSHFVNHCYRSAYATLAGGDIQFAGKINPKPDLLYLISKTLEDLGLTIQDATIANFDVFKLNLLAQQSNEGQYVKPDQIKVILVDLVGDGGAPEV